LIEGGSWFFNLQVQRNSRLRSTFDHLGSTALTAGGASGAKLSELCYKPWGELRYVWGATKTGLCYTGQRLEGTGLYDYGGGARWYDPSLGRFAQADSVVPDSQNPLDYDRYSYVRNNPLNYSDPTGHLPKEEKPVDDWNFFYWQKQERDKKESWWQRQNRLFSYLFLGSGENGTWTQADWVFYYKYRDELWSGQMDWIHPDPVRGWGAFALHVERLASYYSASDKDQFVKDFALVFAGINTTKSFFGATWGSRKRPELPFLNEGNIGLSKEYLT